MNNNMTDAIRAILPFLARLGGSGLTGVLAGRLISQNANKILKLVYTIGGVALGLAVGEVAEKTTLKTIDEFVEAFSMLEEKKKEVEI